jgi:acetyltransferase-like isoleucine patch superfamily enzyme
MIVGFIVYDVCFVVLAALGYGGAIAAGLWLHAALAPLVPALVAWSAASLGGLGTLIAEVGASSALCPRLRPGRHPLLRGAVFYGWIFRSLLRRILFIPGLRHILLTSHTLRWLSLRALGARVAFDSNFAPDVDLTEPSLLEVGAGAVIGMRAAIVGHYVIDGVLHLAPVRIGAGALIGADVGVFPGVTVERGAVVKPRSTLGAGVTIGAGADVGLDCLIENGAVVGAGARIAARSRVPARSIVADGQRWPDDPPALAPPLTETNP